MNGATRKHDMLDFSGRKMDTKGRSFQRELEPLPKARRRSLNPKKALLKKLPGGFAEGELKAVADKAFVTEASWMIVPAAGMVWFTLQLPFALMSLVFLGVASALESVKQAANSNIVTGAVWYIGEKIFNSINAVSEALFGFDFTSLSPDSFFMLTHGLVMLIGWATLFIMGLVYLFMGISPVFGKGSGAKIATLLLACIGYAIPVLNLFPWFGAWALAVWWYPTEE
jgi:hypothetical protein